MAGATISVGTRPTTLYMTAQTTCTPLLKVLGVRAMANGLFTIQAHALIPTVQIISAPNVAMSSSISLPDTFLRMAKITQRAITPLSSALNGMSPMRITEWSTIPSPDATLRFMRTLPRASMSSKSLLIRAGMSLMAIPTTPRMATSTLL